ncbi:MAG TPA: aldose 1-epimerase family protein [Pirellulales bacterium]|nr:aldose 1-epimerase family protein [Pirellulales bacterium]
MPPRTWPIVDVDNGVYVDALQLSPGDVPTAANFSLRKRTLRGGLRDGLDAIEVDNGCLRFTVLPGRGMGLWRVWRGELEVGWPSPVKGPVHPKFVPTDEASGIGWLNGFDELLCRCGLEYNGAPEWSADGKLKHPLHGRIANLPAHFVEVAIDADAGELSITGVIDEARLFGNKLRLKSTVRTKFGEPKLTVIDEIENAWATPADLELLYHINVGPPLAAPGSKFSAPIETIAPRNDYSARDLESWQSYPAPQPGAEETVLYCELAADAEGRTGVLLAAGDDRHGLSLSFNRRQFPYFTLWKNPQAYSDGYCTGLEPCINFPNVKSFEQANGRVARLAPGETRRFEIEMEIHDAAAGIQRSLAQIGRWQAGVAAKVYEAPRPEWSPPE